VLRRGGVLAVAGIAIGAAAAGALTRSLESLLNDVKPADPWVFGITAASIAFAALLACYLPARSAGRVNPVDILRAE
jgi:putative ABC transport system permease protein